MPVAIPHADGDERDRRPRGRNERVRVRRRRAVMRWGVDVDAQVVGMEEEILLSALRRIAEEQTRERSDVRAEREVRQRIRGIPERSEDVEVDRADPNAVTSLRRA